jgi:hypothetical protein
LIVSRSTRTLRPIIPTFIGKKTGACACVPVGLQEVRHHPASVDLEVLKRLLADTKCATLQQFLVKEFSCISKQLAGWQRPSTLALRHCQTCGAVPATIPPSSERHRIDHLPTPLLPRLFSVTSSNPSFWHSNAECAKVGDDGGVCDWGRRRVCLRAERLINEMQHGADVDLDPADVDGKQVLRLHQLMHEVKFKDPDGAHLSPAGGNLLLSGCCMCADAPRPLVPSLSQWPLLALQRARRREFMASRPFMAGAAQIIKPCCPVLLVLPDTARCAQADPSNPASPRAMLRTTLGAGNVASEAAFATR